MLVDRKVPMVGKIAIGFLVTLMIVQEAAPSITAGRTYSALLPGVIVLISAWQYHRKRIRKTALFIVAAVVIWSEALLFVRYLRTSTEMLVLQIVLLAVLLVWAVARSRSRRSGGE